MIIVDTALEKRQAEGNPIRVAMVGAGYMGRGIALQIEKYMTGMRLVAISNRTLSEAKRAYDEAGIEATMTIENIAQLDEAISQNRYAVTDNPLLLCEAKGVEAVIEATGHVELSAHVAM